MAVPLSGATLAGATLTLDLVALKENYCLLAKTAAGAITAAAVKADAYGLGVARVAPALQAAGCRIFFVAHAAEGRLLRRVLPEAVIYVLHGLANSGISSCIEHDLRPVLNRLAEVDIWARDGGGRPAALHVDTGMNRLGLDDAEAAALLAAPERLAFDLAFVMSHLACADIPDHPLNQVQCERFAAYGAALRQALGRPDLPLSLANSAGILLGPTYHFDLVRPGIALYGGNPWSARPNPMAPVVTLEGSVLQVRDVTPPATVGYAATYAPARTARIATVDVGYADGYPRALGGGRVMAELAGVRVPIVGRISMDTLALDVSALPPGAVGPGTAVTLLGGAVALDQLAELSGFSSYELLTALSHRYNRVYKE